MTSAHLNPFLRGQRGQTVKSIIGYSETKRGGGGFGTHRVARYPLSVTFPSPSNKLHIHEAGIHFLLPHSYNANVPSISAKPLVRRAILFVCSAFYFSYQKALAGCTQDALWMPFLLRSPSTKTYYGFLGFYYT